MASLERGSIWHNMAASWAAWTGLLLILPFGDEGGGLKSPLGFTLWGFEHWDKVVHFVLFGVLAWLLRRSFQADGYRFQGALAALVSIAYGGLLELVQMPLPYRGGEWSDLVADAAGAVLAVAMAAAATARRRNMARSATGKIPEV